MKKLMLDALLVESFGTGSAAEETRGTVQAHDADPTRACNTRQPFCLLPSVNLGCVTDVCA